MCRHFGKMPCSWQIRLSSLLARRDTGIGNYCLRRLFLFTQDVGSQVSSQGEKPIQEIIVYIENWYLHRTLAFRISESHKGYEGVYYERKGNILRNVRVESHISSLTRVSSLLAAVP